MEPSLEVVLNFSQKGSLIFDILRLLHLLLQPESNLKVMSYGFGYNYRDVSEKHHRLERKTRYFKPILTHLPNMNQGTSSLTYTSDNTSKTKNQYREGSILKF